MPKRNIVWIAIATVVAVGLWQIPGIIARRDALYNRFSPLLDVRVQILKNYVEEIDEDELVRGAIRGMLGRLDPYCEFLDPAEHQQIRRRTDGQFSGIGIQVERASTGELLVVSPIEGSPAFLKGIRSGDLITRVNGENTADLPDLRTGVELITGDPGTTVTLGVYRPATDEVLEFKITRGIVTLPTIRGWARTPDGEWDYLIDRDARIAYVRVLSFEGRTADQLDEVINALLARHRMRGLVLDVRDNPGGLLDVVVTISNRFLSEGRIVSTRGRQTGERPYLARPDPTYPDFPMAVVVNKGSASASEILAGALRDHGRAVLVGERTFGKGSVQELIPLGDPPGSQGAVKLTTAYYYLPNGERIHGRGVMPDHLVELTLEEREAKLEAQRRVHAVDPPSRTTQPTTDTAPADVPELIEILIDRQLEEAISILRERLATRPAA